MPQVIGEAEKPESFEMVRASKTLSDLKGKRIAVPVGSTAHFSLMGALAKAKVEENDLTIMNMPPDQIAAAWEQDAIDGAFIWQPVQSKLLESGTLLVGANKTAEWGWPTFDGWVVNKDFAAKNGDKLAAFTKVMNAANMDYLANKSSWTCRTARPFQAIAFPCRGEILHRFRRFLKGFTFLPLDEQVKPMWLDGAAASAMQANRTVSCRMPVESINVAR